MAKDTCKFTDKKGSLECISKNAKRNNYFSGKLMTHEHLIEEQQYYIDKLKQMNREFTGYGVVNGLVATYNNEKITVSPGIGIDSCGNVLALHSEKVFEDIEISDNDYIYLRFKEKGTESAARYTKDSCRSGCCDDYIEESMEIFTRTYKIELKENKICGEIKNIHTIKKLTANEKDLPFLLLGQYRDKTIISTTPILHTNAELSKLLCDINASYVKSLNGKTGEIKIEAGANISIETKEKTITIASTASNDLHREYHIFDTKNTQTIKHKLGTFPSVDIYESGDNTNRTAILKKTLESNAEDLNINFKTYKESLNAHTIKEAIEKEILLENNLAFDKPIEQLWENKELWKNKKVIVPPHSLLSLSQESLEKYIDQILIIDTAFYYTKLAGFSERTVTERINVRVTHLSPSTLKLEMISPPRTPRPNHLLVILNG